jgi:hypothetical protein
MLICYDKTCVQEAPQLLPFVSVKDAQKYPNSVDPARWIDVIDCLFASFLSFIAFLDMGPQSTIG